MSILDRMKPGNPFWNRIPEQVTRLSVAFVLVIAALVSRSIELPEREALARNSDMESPPVVT